MYMHIISSIYSRCLFCPGDHFVSSANSASSIAECPLNNACIEMPFHPMWMHVCLSILLWSLNVLLQYPQVCMAFHQCSTYCTLTVMLSDGVLSCLEDCHVNSVCLINLLMMRLRQWLKLCTYTACGQCFFMCAHIQFVILIRQLGNQVKDEITGKRL